MGEAEKARGTRDQLGPVPDGGEAAFPFPPVPVLGGLTASGKTALAVALARDYPVTVVSADAMMVYRGLDVGTAKPTPEERALAPHLLLDVLDVTEDSSVGWWAPRAEEAVRQVVQAGRIPLVVGGTGFYLRALTLGRPNVPPSRPERIAALEAELERVGLDALAGRLRAASPLDAERAQRNPRRVLRALEVLEATGRPPSAFGHAPPAFPTLAVALMPPVETVDARIELRAGQMFRDGLLDEAAWLRSLSWPEGRRPTALQAIGYREAGLVLDGALSEPEAVAALALATRRYAKRQRTWFTRQPGFHPAASADAARALLTPLLDAWQAQREGPLAPRG